MKYIALITLTLTVTACSQPSDTVETHGATQVDHVISVNMTYDRPMPHDATAITAVPNNVAPWVSSLFILDEEGQLLRGGLETGDFKPIASNIQEIKPLARKNASGIIMARTADSIAAYIEINEEGDYKDIPFVKTPQNISGFCETKDLYEQRIYGHDTREIFALEVISPTANGRVEAVKIESTPTVKGNCMLSVEGNNVELIPSPKHAIQTALLNQNMLIFTTNESKERPRLFMQQDNVVTAIDITGGLTTIAPTQIDSFSIIHNNLGGVLRNGAVLITDNASERVIYLSLDLLNRRLAEANSLSDQQ